MFKNRIQFARVLAVLTMSMLSMLSWESALAQDVVFTRSSKGTETPRKGTVVDWQGDTLTIEIGGREKSIKGCLLYTSPSPRDRQKSRMPSSA